MQPNLMLLCLEEWRHDAPGFAGNAIAKTPHFDALAANGWRARDCHASSASPMGNLEMLMRGEGAGIAIAEAARRAGYDTMAAGWPLHGNLADGFGRLAPCSEPAAMNDTALVRSAFGAVRSNKSEAEHPVGQTADGALQLLRTAVEPFLLAVFFPGPRLPLDPPAPWDSLFPPEQLPLPEYFRLPARREEELHGLDFSQMTEARFRRVLSYYHAMQAYLDHQAGRLLSTLAARGFGPTAVLATGAAGHYLGEDGRTAREAAPRPHEALSRVPAVLAGFPGLARGVHGPRVMTLDLHQAMRAFLAGAPPRFPA